MRKTPMTYACQFSDNSLETNREARRDSFDQCEVSRTEAQVGVLVPVVRTLLQDKYLQHQILLSRVAALLPAFSKS